MVVDLPFFMGTLLPPLAGTGTRSGTIPGEGCLVIFFFFKSAMPLYSVGKTEDEGELGT